MSICAASPRPYRQGARARKTELTRRSIIEAARRHIIDGGYTEMRMEDVAATAGVVRASVFRHFPNKAALLRAVEEDAAERVGVGQLVAALDELPPLAALSAAVQRGCRIWAKERRVFREFYGAAQFDETLRPLVRRKESQRRSLVRALVARLVDAGLVRPTVAPRAAEAIWLLTGFTAFDSLSHVRGLSVRAAAQVIEGTIVDAFIARRRKGRPR